MLYLNESMRQREDLLFDSLLRKIRLGIVDKSIVHLIKNVRLKPYEIPHKLEEGILPTILVGTNKAANEMNKLHYSKLTTPEYEVSGKFVWRDKKTNSIKMDTLQAKRVKKHLFYILYFMYYIFMYMMI